MVSSIFTHHYRTSSNGIYPGSQGKQPGSSSNLNSPSRQMPVIHRTYIGRGNFDADQLNWICHKRRQRPLHVDKTCKNFETQLHVETTVEYDLPPHIYPPPGAAPILMVDKEYKLKNKRRTKSNTATVYNNFLASGSNPGIGTGRISNTSKDVAVNNNNNSSYVSNTNNNSASQEIHCPCKLGARCQYYKKDGRVAATRAPPIVDLESPVRVNIKPSYQTTKQSKRSNKPSRTSQSILYKATQESELIDRNRQLLLQQIQPAQQQQQQQTYPVPPPSYATATGINSFYAHYASGSSASSVGAPVYTQHKNHCPGPTLCTSSSCKNSSMNLSNRKTGIDNPCSLSSLAATPMIAAVPPVEMVAPHAISEAHTGRSRGSPKLRVNKRQIIAAHIPEYQRRPRSNTIGHTSLQAKVNNASSVHPQSNLLQQPNQYNNITKRNTKTTKQQLQSSAKVLSDLSYRQKESLEQPPSSYLATEVARQPRRETPSNYDSTTTSTSISSHHQFVPTFAIHQDRTATQEARISRPRIADTAQMYSMAPITPGELMEEGNLRLRISLSKALNSNSSINNSNNVCSKTVYVLDVQRNSFSTCRDQCKLLINNCMGVFQKTPCLFCRSH